jgi:hypothetical protein
MFGLVGWLLAMGYTTATLAQLDPQGAISNPPPVTGDVFRRQIQLPLGGALRNPQPDRAAKDLIDQAVHYFVHQLGVADQALNRVENMRRLLDLLRANNTTENARAYASEQVILRCRQLLQEPSAEVRVVACHLLNGLNYSWNPEVPYTPAGDALLEVLEFPDEKYVHVKVVATNGLARILRDSPPNRLPVLKRIEIAEKLSAATNRLRDARGQAGAAPKVGYDWAMWSLVQALGFSDRVANQARQPVVADTLLRVLIDSQEDWMTRARAADALCRLPDEGTTNLAVLNYEIARLLHDGAQQYNSECAAGVVSPMWRRFGLHIYMSYESQNAATRTLNQGLMYQTNRGGLGGHKAAIQAARGLMLPIVNSWVANPLVPDATGQLPTPRPIPAGDIQNLGNWLNANAPVAGSKLLPESQVQPPASAPAPNGN